MFFKFKQTTLIVILCVFIFTNALFLVPQKAWAQGLPVIDAQQVQLKTQDTILKTIMGIIGAVVFKALMSASDYFLQKLAYDAAVWMAAGGKGQGTLFEYKDFGSYISDVALDTAGEAIGSLSEGWPIDLCAPALPELPEMPEITMNIQLGLADTREPRPRCSWNQLSANWEEFISTVSSGEVLSEYAKSLRPDEGGLSSILKLHEKVETDEARKTQAALEDRRENEGIKPVTMKISGYIKTPSVLVRESTTEKLVKQPSKSEDKKVSGTTNMKDSLIFMGLNVGSMFLNTLTSNLFKNIMGGMFDVGQLVSDRASLWDLGATEPSGGRIAAEEIFADLLTPQIMEITNYNPLNEFTACPTERGSNNCAMDAKLATALTETSSGNSITIKEALKKGYLHSNWPLIPLDDKSRNQDPNCYTYGYCYSNLVKLRKARILSIGWELAANSPSNNVGNPVTLGKVIEDFDKCDTGDVSPWCHLIDPNWILKLPATQCKLQVSGSRLALAAGDIREKVCADMPSCIEENNDGTCDGNWGYCTREKNIWRIESDSCPAEYSSCETLTNREGKKVSYLRNTLDYDGCNEGNVGCNWYSLAKTSVGDWNPDERIYLNKNAEQCDASFAGCSDLIRKGTGVSQNYIKNSSFEININKESPNDAPDNWEVAERYDPSGAGIPPMVIPNHFPTADISSNWTGPEPNVEVRTGTITISGDNSTSGDESIDEKIRAYDWLFQNNTTRAGTTKRADRIPVREQTSPTDSSGFASGIYAVNLTVTDDYGLKDMDSIVLAVGGLLPESPNNPPDAFIQGPSNLDRATIGTLITLDGRPSTDDDGSIASYSWEIIKPDRSIVTGSGPTFSFTPDNSYLGVSAVMLTVMDNFGAGDMSGLFINVIPAPTTVCSSLAYYEEDTSESYHGEDAITGCPKFTQGDIHLESGNYVLSAYAKQAGVGGSDVAEIIVKTTEDDVVSNTNCIKREYEIVLPITPGSEYQRGQCYFTLNRADTVDISTQKNRAVWIDSVQLEEGIRATSYRETGYPFGVEHVNLRVPPSYLGCGENQDDNPECSTYARMCSAEEVNCELYTPVNGDPSIAAIVSNEDRCPAECSGYDLFRQGETNFELADPEVYLIPRSATNCSYDVAGCDEFTDTETEEKMYYSFLRQCSVVGGATYYTWEGSDTTGYQLKSWSLLRGTARAGEAGNPPAYQSGFTDFDLCAEDIFRSGINPDCREFYDEVGNISYRLYSKTVVVTDDCKELRRAPIDFDSARQELDCDATGGEWTGGQCLYNGYLPESVSCGASYVGCRAYTGNTGRNVRMLFNDNFEEGVAVGWSPERAISVSTEAIQVGGHSLRVNNSSPFIFRRSVENIKEGSAYTLSFWAKGASSNLTVSFMAASGGTPLYFSSPIAPQVRLASEWRLYTLGPVYFNRAPAIDEFLNFEVLNIIGGASANIFIDNIILREVVENIYLIKDSWYISPSCDMTIQGAPLPQAMVGCQEYKDRANTTRYLKSFTKLCADDAVGCEAFIDTKNTESAFAETWNARCVVSVNTDDGMVESATECTVDGTTYCNVLPGENTCYFKTSEEITEECDFPFLASLITQRGTGTYAAGICLGNKLDGNSDIPLDGPDSITVPEDETIYAVYDENFVCDASNIGCSKVGYPKKGVCNLISPCVDEKCECTISRTFNISSTTSNNLIVKVCEIARGGTSCTFDIPKYFNLEENINYEERFLKINPERFDSVLCKNDELMCEVFRTKEGSPIYAKDPRGQTCEYRKNVKVSGVEKSGWFRKGMSEPCNGELDYEIYRNADILYSGWVGECPEKESGCTTLVDVVDISPDYPDGKPYNLIRNEKLDTKSCKGQVSRIEGCVLFNDLNNPTSKYRADSTYLKSRDEEAGGLVNAVTCPANEADCKRCRWEISSGAAGTRELVDSGYFDTVCASPDDCAGLTPPLRRGSLEILCVSPTSAENKIQNDSNLILKVRPDRVCGEWLACRSTVTVYDETAGRDKKICTAVDLCREYEKSGEKETKCTKFVEGDNADELLDVDAYVSRNVEWSGMDYAGYSIPNQYQISDLEAVEIGGEKRLVYVMGDIDSEIITTYGDSDEGTPCGTLIDGVADPLDLSRNGLIYDGKCVQGINGLFPGSQLYTREARKNLAERTCRAYPEQNSPFPYTIAEWDRYYDAETKGALSAKKQGFTNAQVCERNAWLDGDMDLEVDLDSDPKKSELKPQDCECSYQKATYGNAGQARYFGYNQEFLPEGFCLGGPRDGLQCTPGIEGICGPMEEGGTCERLTRADKFLGMEGFCLEYDYSSNINSNREEYACLTWRPVEIPEGGQDIYNQYDEAGYNPPSAGVGKYYCLMGKGNALSSIPVIPTGTYIDFETKRINTTKLEPFLSRRYSFKTDRDGDTTAGLNRAPIGFASNELPNSDLGESEYMEKIIRPPVSSSDPDLDNTYPHRSSTDGWHIARILEEGWPLYKSDIAAIILKPKSAQSDMPDESDDKGFTSNKQNVLSRNGEHNGKFTTTGPGAQTYTYWEVRWPDTEDGIKDWDSGYRTFGTERPLFVAPRLNTAGFNECEGSCLFGTGWPFNADTDDLSGASFFELDYAVMHAYPGNMNCDRAESIEAEYGDGVRINNYFAVRAYFDENDKFMGFWVSLCDNSGGAGDIKFDVEFLKTEPCLYLAQVVKDGENTARTENISANSERKLGTYSYDQYSKPFGSVASGFKSPEMAQEPWFISADGNGSPYFTTDYFSQSAVDAGSPLGCRVGLPLTVIPRYLNYHYSDSESLPGKDNKWEEGVGSTGRLGCFDINQEKRFLSYELNDVKKEFQEFFADVYQVYKWDNATRAYTPIDDTAHPSVEGDWGNTDDVDLADWDITALDVDRTDAVKYLGKPVEISAPGVDGSEGRFSINDKTWSAINESLYLIGYEIFDAVVKFHAWANSDQMPIRSRWVLWGDNTPAEKYYGKYKNHKPSCDGSTFGDTADTCEAGYFEMSHLYICNEEMVNEELNSPDLLDVCELTDVSIDTEDTPYNVIKNTPCRLSAANATLLGIEDIATSGAYSCAYKPSMRVIDNWGWCTAANKDNCELETLDSWTDSVQLNGAIIVSP